MIKRFALGLAAAVAFAGQAAAQGEVLLRPDPPCEGCTVRFEPLDTLGAATDPVSPGPTAEAGLLSSGEVVVSSPPIGRELAVYMPAGAYSRALGSGGAGPGEFSSAPLVVVVAGDTIVTLDQRAGRVTRFSADGDYLSSIPLQLRAMTFAARPGGGVVVSGFRADSVGAGIVHIIGPDGTVATSFGPPPGAASTPFEVVRELALAPDGSIWTAVIAGGRLERWSSQGNLLQAFRIDDPELQRPVGMRVDFSRERPPGRISDLAVDASGRIWVYYVVADEGFEPSPNAGRAAPESIYDTRVIVVDPVSEAVVAAGRFDGLVRPLGPGRAYDLVSLPSGDRRLVTGRIGIVEAGAP